MLRKTLAILSFTVFVFSCTNDVPKPTNQTNNEEKNIQGGETKANSPEITPDMLQKDIDAIESFSQTFENKVKELDAYVSKLPKDKANEAQPLLEEMMGMQEKSMGMREQMDGLKPMVEAIATNPEAYQNAGNVDGGPQQVQAAIDDLKVTVEGMKTEMARYESEIRKIGG
jgi:peptidoglycan hydrolase CwlO-like protein